MKYTKPALIAIILLLGFLLIYNWRLLSFDAKICGTLPIVAAMIILINEIRKEQKINKMISSGGSWKILGQQKKRIKLPSKKLAGIDILTGSVKPINETSHTVALEQSNQ